MPNENETELSDQAKINAMIRRELAETLMLNETARLTSKKADWYELVLFVGFAAALLAAGKYLL